MVTRSRTAIGSWVILAGLGMTPALDIQFTNPMYLDTGCNFINNYGIYTLYS